MSPLLIPILALLIPIVAILAGTWAKVEKMKAGASRDLNQATGHLEDALADARADRDRLRRRVEALEAIVTSEDWDLEREAQRAGLTGAASEPFGPSAGRIDPEVLDGDAAPTNATRRRRARQG